MIENRTIGSLLRTKASHFNEGGVAAGYGVVDQPFIIPASVIADKSKGLAAKKVEAAIKA